MSFDKAFDRIIGHEGGYVNHPNDPGGETKYGISKLAYPNEDIKNLTIDRAKELYKRDYWDRARADEYDFAIGFRLFDIAVNSGIGNAIRMLQKAAGVAPDGQIGPISIQAIKSKPVKDILMLMSAERLEFYAALSTFDTFGRGWARRVASNLRAAVEDTNGLA